jgi:hypothetical protein
MASFLDPPVDRSVTLVILNTYPEFAAQTGEPS